MKLLERILGKRGYEKMARNLAISTNTTIKVRKLTAWSSEDYRTVAILNTFGINKVLDVGANIGQFAESLYDFGYKGEVISFEPTSSAHEELLKKASSNNQWQIAEKCAIGDTDGTVDLNVSNNSVFNSIKTIDDSYASYNNESKVIAKENVNIYKMDSLQDKYFNKEESLFLKVDTQGFEQEVLDGSKELLNYVKGVKIEVPLQPIYQNVDWGMVEIINFFKDHNFKCISMAEVGVNKKTGVVYEVDMIFLKNELLDEHKD